MHKRKLRLMGELIAGNKWLFIGAAACTLLQVVMDYMPPLLLAETMDYYLGDQSSTMPAFINRLVDSWGGADFMARNLWIVGIALVLINVVCGVFSYGKARLQSMAGENVALYLRERLYRHIQRLPFSYHVKAETGDLIQRCTSDVDTVRKTLANQLMAIFWSVLMVAVALFVLFTKDWRLALISMVMVPALFIFAYMFFNWVHKSFTKADEAEGKMSAVLQENLTGVRVVRAFGQQQYEVEKFDRVSEDFRDKTFKSSKLLSVYWSVSDALSMAQSCITLLVCVFFAARGEITVGTMVIFTSYVGKLLWPIRQLGRTLSDISKSFVALSRIDEVLEEKEEPEEKVVFSKEEFIEKNADGVLLNWLIPNAQKNMMEPVLVELAEKATTAPDVPHEGEEFGFVLEGRIAIALGNKRHLCKKGEAFYYVANKPHYLINKGTGKAKLIWVATPPTF